jgi:predicted membrane-bound spermidine synthase
MQAGRPRYRTALAFVFFCSGAVSLIFQVAWQRLLTLPYGVGPVSITLIVSVYMFGLGFGSLLGGYLAERTRHRVALYLAIELCLGLFGLLSLPYLDFLARHTAGCGPWLSFLCIAGFLSLPTLAMGMTLPLIVKIFSRQARDFLDTVSFLYFVNTLGAGCGALLASYVLISFLGLDRTIYVAAAADFVLAGVIFLAQRSLAAEIQPTASPTATAGDGLRRRAYALVLLTGFVAIGYEIVWFRVLEVLVKASPYAFSSVLAVYLTGIALGSFFMCRFLRRRPALDRKGLFFLLQFLLGAFVLLSFSGYYHLTKHTRFGVLTRLSFGSDLHPALGYSTDYSSLERLFLSLDIFFWPAVFVLVPTLLMGASFPLITHLAMTDADQEGRTVGRVYFWNTVGNVLGGILTGFVILPGLGTEPTLFVLSAVSVCLLAGRRRWAGWAVPPAARVAVCAALLAAALVVFPGRGELYAVIHPPAPPGSESHFAEGIDGIVLTRQQGDEVHNYINGLAHGGRPGYGFYREAVEALSYAPRAEKVLVIGFGTGSITEAALKLREVRQVTLVEINRTLLTNLAQMEVFRRTLTDPRLQVVIDDGRRFLLQSADTYDLILIDPLRTATAYSNNLYSHEFFELAARRLSAGGIFLVWMDEGFVLPRTLLSAFPEVRVYNFFCLGSDAPFHRNRHREEALLAAFTPAERQGMVDFPTEYRGGAAYVSRVTQGFPINHDWRPNCEYFLGMHFNKKRLVQRAAWGSVAAAGLLGLLALVRRRRRQHQPTADGSGTPTLPGPGQPLRAAG